jgi:adenylylsulfate kinase-like enzyme
MTINKGTLYWITGLSGSGKTSIAELVYKNLKKSKKGLVFLDGDVMRYIMDLKNSGYDKASRKKIAYVYSKFCKHLTDQGIDVLFATIAMYHEVREWNRSNIDNYIEIYIKAPLEFLVENDKKELYKNALDQKVNNVVGVDIKFEEPLNPDIVLVNNGKISIEELAADLLKKIKQNQNNFK